MEAAQPMSNPEPTPNPQSATEPTPQPTPAPSPANNVNATGTPTAKDSVLKLDQNIAGLISWLLPIVALIYALAEKENKFVKFHAWQSLAWSVGIPLLAFVVSFLSGVINTFTPDFISWIFTLAATVFSCLAFFSYIVNIIGAIKAYNNEMWKVPFFGNFAEKQANK